MNTSTRSNNDERGRWKFVMSRSTTCQSKPPWMKSEVSPESGPRAAAFVRARSWVPTATTTSRGAGVERLGRHAVLLTVDHVILGAIGDNGTERVDAHDELDGADLDVTSAASLQESRREVQPRGRRCDRTRTRGVHRLVPLGIVERRVDVGRQRHRAVTIECIEWVVREQPDSHAAGVVEPLTDLHRELVSRGMHRAQHLADAEAPRGRTTRAIPRLREDGRGRPRRCPRLARGALVAAPGSPVCRSRRARRRSRAGPASRTQDDGRERSYRAASTSKHRVAVRREPAHARRRQVVLERPHGRCLVCGHRGGMVVAGCSGSIQVYGPGMAITTRTDQLTAHDGGRFDGHVWLPDAGSGPGLLLLQEIFGVGPYVRSVAERLTGQGYVVLAPDVFWRVQRNWEADHDEKGLTDSIGLMGKFDFVQGVDDCVATFEHLDEMREVTRGTGVIGFCMGGLLTYHVAAATEPQVAVSYYGSNIASSLDLSGKITCPIIFHFGEPRYHPHRAGRSDQGRVREP